MFPLNVLAILSHNCPIIWIKHGQHIPFFAVWNHFSTFKPSLSFFSLLTVSCHCDLLHLADDITKHALIYSLIRHPLTQPCIVARTLASFRLTCCQSGPVFKCWWNLMVDISLALPLTFQWKRASDGVRLPCACVSVCVCVGVGLLAGLAQTRRAHGRGRGRCVGETDDDDEWGMSVKGRETWREV